MCNFYFKNFSIFFLFIKNPSFCLFSGSPLYVNVFNLDKVTLRGEYTVVPVNKVCNLRLNTVGAGNGHFTALAKGG